MVSWRFGAILIASSPTAQTNLVQLSGTLDSRMVTFPNTFFGIVGKPVKP